MSIFSGMFQQKSGKGIGPNDPKSPPIIYFFELLGRKIFSLVQLNALHVACSIPAIILLYLFSQVYFSQNFIELTTPADAAANYMAKFGLSIFFLCIPAVCVGPAQAGFSFVLKNFVKEEHVWVFHDYIQNAKSNLKQSIIVCVINFGILWVMMFAFNTYFYAFTQTGSFAPLIFLSVALVLFLMVNMYIYPLMVTFKLSTFQLYRNALLFSYMRFYLNILIIFFSFVVFFLLLAYANPIIFIFLFVFILPSLIGFLSTFIVYPALKKYIVEDDKKPIRIK